MELFSARALDLVRRIRARELSPRELLEAHLSRIQAVNPGLNALVVPRFAAAREEAARAERALASPSFDPPPLFGLPISVKEMIAVAGLPNTGGVVARRSVVASEDAPQVARLRAAGCIIVGLTNVSEAGLWLESYNRVYGRTNNAWSADRISGGSSGGEGALIGAGGSPLGLGADIGGSIRNPCFFNGIYGHKPSGGLLPSEGHWPPVEGPRGRHCVLGPMGRSARDLSAVMELLSPEDDPFREPGRPPFRRLTGARPEQVTVCWYDDNGLVSSSDPVKETVARTVEILGRLGFRIERWRPDGVARSAEIWAATVSSTDDTSVRQLLGNGEAIPLFQEWARLPFGRSRHHLITLLLASLEGIAKPGTSHARKMIEKGRAMRQEIEAKLGPSGVLLCPVYPRSAPPHDQPLRSPLGFSYCGLFNALELPSTAVPTGFCPEGLPLGVQIVGRAFNDPLTLWVAEQLEQAMPAWRPA